MGVVSVDWGLVLGLVGFLASGVSGIVALYFKSEFGPLKERIHDAESELEKRREDIKHIYGLIREIERAERRP